MWSFIDQMLFEYIGNNADWNSIGADEVGMNVNDKIIQK